MTPGRTHLVRLLLAFVAAAPLAATAATDPSFQFTATASDFGSYFPGYLANGYFSTMTSPRGTEGNPAYMVAFMDYKPGDISRPAAIPGWSEIDYNPGGGWLNRTRLDAKIFSGYAQTLDMHEGTLTTRYRFAYANKATDVQVVTFVSQADPHLAATQLSITPQFDGKVQLSFPLRLWSEHQPRFPIGTMDGEQMIAAVIASGQNLDNKPVPTPDRAPVWYPGFTRVLSTDGDTKALSLRLQGQAEHGLSMAEAAVIGLPAGLAVEDVKLEQGPYKLSLELVANLHKGQTYTFTKYVALSRQNWGGDDRADLELAEAAHRQRLRPLAGRASGRLARLVESRHRDRRQSGGAESGALGSVLPAVQYHRRHRLADGRLRVDPQLRRACVLGQRLVGVPRAAAAASGTGQTDRDVPRPHHRAGAGARQTIRRQGHHVSVGGRPGNRRRQHAAFRLWRVPRGARQRRYRDRAVAVLPGQRRQRTG